MATHKQTRNAKLSTKTPRHQLSFSDKYTLDFCIITALDDVTGAIRVKATRGCRYRPSAASAAATAAAVHTGRPASARPTPALIGQTAYCLSSLGNICRSVGRHWPADPLAPQGRGIGRACRRPAGCSVSPESAAPGRAALFRRSTRRLGRARRRWSSSPVAAVGVCLDDDNFGGINIIHI